MCTFAAQVSFFKIIFHEFLLITAIAQNSEGFPHVELTCPHPNVTRDKVYYYSIEAFFRLCRSTRPLSCLTAASLVNFQFQMLPHLADDRVFVCEELDPEAFRLNVISCLFILPLPHTDVV